MKNWMLLLGLIVTLPTMSIALAADASLQPEMQTRIKEIKQSPLSNQKTTQTKTTKSKTDLSTQKQHSVDTRLPSPNVTVQRKPIQPLPQIKPGMTPRNLRQAQSRNLPQVNRTVVDSLRDSVHIRVSGVGTYGGSTVGGDNGALLLRSPEFIVMVNQGPLSMTGVVPGEATGYNYYLYINSPSMGRPTGCAVDPRTGLPRGGSPEQVRPLGSGYSRQIRDVRVATDASRVLRYYLMLCVVGTRGEPREFAAVASNMAEIQVLGESSQR